MSFPILSIPAASDNPSNSQPDLQQNFTNISGYLSVDHTAPGSSGAGQHNRVTYTNISTQATPTDPVSVLYTNSGSGLHTEPQLVFKNSQSFYFLNVMRTYLLLDLPAGTALNGFNVISVGKVGTVYTITFNPTTISNSSTNANTGIIITGNNQPVSYNFAANVLTLTTAATSRITFIVLQI